MDYIELDANKFGFFCTLKLKSVTCRLLENHVTPTVHKNFSLEKLIKKYAKEYSINCTIPSIDSIKIENFYVDMGMTAFDVFKIFFYAISKKDIFLTEEKNLSFVYKPPTPLFFGKFKKNSSNFNGIDFVNFRMIDNRANLISDAYVHILYNNDYNEFLHLDEKNIYATNCNINRTRYCSVPPRWQILPQNGSNYMVEKENNNRFLYEITTFEDVDIFPGMLAKIKKINDQNLIVFKVLKSVNDKGLKTKIYFKNYK